jgi:hypothetical protein
MGVRKYVDTQSLRSLSLRSEDYGLQDSCDDLVAFERTHHSTSAHAICEQRDGELSPHLTSLLRSSSISSICGGRWISLNSGLLVTQNHGGGGKN